MAQFIIDIPDDKMFAFVGRGRTLLIPYTMAGHEAKHDTGLLLTPYTVPDLEQVKADAYNDGYKAGREAEKVRHPDLKLIKQKAHDNGYSEGFQDGYCKGMNDYLQKPEVKEESDRAYAHGYSDAESKFSEIRKEAYEKGYKKCLSELKEEGMKIAQNTRGAV